MKVQLIMAIFPILNIVAYHSIDKFGMAVVLNIILGVGQYGLAYMGIALPFPYSFFPVSLINVYFMYRWTKQYNEKISNAVI